MDVHMGEKRENMPAGYRNYCIGILSDTHGLLRPEVTETLKGCGAILHGGDINCQEILDQLGQIAPVYVVRGNNDKEWAERFPHAWRTDIFHDP